MCNRNVLFLFSGIALFIAMANLPYGYYQLLRFFICGVSFYACILNYKVKNKVWLWIFGTIALLFNPFVKIHFDKEIWQIVDLSIGLIFWIYFFIQMKDKKIK